MPVPAILFDKVDDSKYLFIQITILRIKDIERMMVDVKW